MSIADTASSGPGDLTVVSNRLPVKVGTVGGERKVRMAPGGLVTAMRPVLERNRGTWIGWDGGVGAKNHALIRESAGQFPFSLEPVPLPKRLLDLYYRGFANATLWPVFHDLLGQARYRVREWEAYCEANRRFAEAAAEATSEGDTIWFHDYHLFLAAREIRRQFLRRLLHFLHIPFPPPDIFARLPWRAEILRGLLSFDLLGFQTARDVENFLHCVTRFAEEVEVESRTGHPHQVVRFRDREVRVAAFPISIDHEEFENVAATETVRRKAERIRRRYRAEKLVLGADRLDYTKGIPERLRGFRRLLDSHPEYRGKASLIQVTVPSRQSVEEYRRLKAEIERMVGEINGRYSTGGWVPIHYIHRSLDRQDLTAHYRAADAALVTPLKDGMNLVAKEYCASNVEENGVVILSEFAGAAAELGEDCLMVNPLHTVQVAETIHRAFTMSPEEKRERMIRLREKVRRLDVHHWAETFLHGAPARLSGARSREARAQV